MRVIYSPPVTCARAPPNYSDRNCADKGAVRYPRRFTPALSFNYKKISLEKCAGYARIKRAAAITYDAHYLRIYISRACMHVSRGERPNAGAADGCRECLYKELQSTAVFSVCTNCPRQKLRPFRARFKNCRQEENSVFRSPPELNK